MLAEFLEALFEDNAETKKAKLFQLPGEKRNAFIDQNGTIRAVPLPPPLRDSRVDAAEDLVNAARAYGIKERMSIWLASDRVVLVTDDDDRLDRVTLHLRETEQWKTIKKLASTPKLDHPQLISLLRAELPGAGDAGRALLEKVRKINFKNQVEGFSDVQHGRESLGRSIENQVTGIGEIPEQLEVVTALYDNPGERDKECAIVIDLQILPADQRFRLKPTPDSMEGAQHFALLSIRTEIEKALPGVRIFFGTP